MSRIILSLFFVALLGTIIAEVHCEDVKELPVVYGCDPNDLNKQFETLKATILAMNEKFESLKENTDDIKPMLEKLSNDLKLNNDEMNIINDRLNQIESRQPQQTVVDEVLNASEILYPIITSTVKITLDELHMSDNQIQHEINNLSHSKPIETSDMPLWDEHFNCLQNCTPTEKFPQSCAEINDTTWRIQLIHIPNSGLQPFYVFCQGQETLIQRREIGAVNFNRNWHDYKHGFGDLNGEYWLGLERIHALTKDGKHLKIRMIDFEWAWLKADYTNFSIDNENNKYKLNSLGKYTGDFWDGFGPHVGYKFSTFDEDNGIRCAGFFQSGWWFTDFYKKYEEWRYTDCYMSNLNGRYCSYGNRITLGGIQFNVHSDSMFYVAMLLTEARDS